jgi:hypothetical protein
MFELSDIGIPVHDIQDHENIGGPSLMVPTTYVGAAWFRGQHMICVRQANNWSVRLSQYLPPATESALLAALAGQLSVIQNRSEPARPPARFTAVSLDALRQLFELVSAIYGQRLKVQSCEIRDVLFNRPSFLTEPRRVA